jgi:hypothetical protein
MPQNREPPLSSQTILWLQTTSGNRAVQRLLARKAAQCHSEQQLLVISDQPQQLEIPPESRAMVVLERRPWWQRILQWFFRKRTP